ncbi:MAG: ASCH domain-containing protein [Gemmatimonadetes bacterium]|nr:ASCH domain-containing protein [Gemmatimonadota bacterium]
MDERTLVLSVKPRFAAKLLGGEKTVELRRILPRRTKPGDLLLIYSTAPETRFVGFCRVTKVLLGSPDTLWPQVQGSAGVTHAEYRQYFGNASRAVGIEVEQPVRLLAELSLEESRTHAPDFRPPQSFRYLSSLDEKLREMLHSSMQRAKAGQTRSAESAPGLG